MRRTVEFALELCLLLLIVRAVLFYEFGQNLKRLWGLMLTNNMTFLLEWDELTIIFRLPVCSCWWTERRALLKSWVLSCCLPLQPSAIQPADSHTVSPSHVQLGFADQPNCQAVSNGLYTPTAQSAQVAYTASASDWTASFVLRSKYRYYCEAAERCAPGLQSSDYSTPAEGKLTTKQATGSKPLGK